VGPDLSHVASRETLGAGALMSSPDGLEQWISNPQRYKPGCLMPNQRLRAEDAHALAMYLGGRR
jgi:cytochrome c oxidase subunit II